MSMQHSSEFHDFFGEAIRRSNGLSDGAMHIIDFLRTGEKVIRAGVEPAGLERLRLAEGIGSRIVSQPEYVKERELLGEQ